MKNNIRLVLIILFSGILCTLGAQELEVYFSQLEEEKTNLFEFGKEITSAGTNFENLFQNWPKYVKNGGEVELISYKCIDVVKSKKQAKRYLKKNLYTGAPGWNWSFSGGRGNIYDDSSAWQIRTILSIQIDTDARITESSSELNKIIETLLDEYIHPGDKIFEITYICKLIKQTHYVFVNSETNKVMTRACLFGVSIPVADLEIAEDGNPEFYLLQQKRERTNLFEFGKEITSAEANFENLFRNWPRYVENADEIELISYKCVDVVKSKKQGKRYLKKNLYTGAPGWGWGLGGGGGYIFGNTKQIDTMPSIRVIADARITESSSELNKIIETLLDEYIHPGDKIFEITYIYKLIKHTHYVFVNSETNKVMTKSCLFGVSIPVADLEMMENRGL